MQRLSLFLVFVFLLTFTPTSDAIHNVRSHQKRLAAKTKTRDADVWLVGFGGSHGSTYAEMSRAFTNQLYKRNGHVMVANANLATLVATAGDSQAIGYSPHCHWKNGHCVKLLFGQSHPAKITNDRAEIQEVAKGGGESNGTGGWWLCEVHATCGDTCWNAAVAEMGSPARGNCANCTYNFPANYGTLVNLNDQECRDHWCTPDAKTGVCVGTCMNCNLWPSHLGIAENPDTTGVHTYWMRAAYRTGRCYCYENSVVVDDSHCANQMAKNVKTDVKKITEPVSTDVDILSKLRDPHLEKAVEDFDITFEF